VQVTGSSGDNFVMTSDGNDTLNGGLGNDLLLGEGGADHFVFDAFGEANADTIGGFSKEEWTGPDKIVLDSNAMTGLGAAGQLADDDERWHAAAGATGGAEADDRVVYDTDTGRLYYDADGSGAGEAQLIATVNGASLAGSDIIIA
jgi:Ca2+-binding RTX toxin-like protein